MDNIRVAKVDSVALELFIPPTTADARPTREKRTITLHLTPHHLIFSPPPQAASSSTVPPPAEIWVPYPSIVLCKRLPQTIAGLYPLQIRTRNFESYVLLFDKDRDGGAEDVWQSVRDCAVATSVEQLYAFFYSLPTSSPKAVQSKPPLTQSLSSPLSLAGQADAVASDARPATPSPPQGGWNTFNPRTEFARQGLGSRTKAWRFTDINKDYSFCPTYPNKLVVPSRISDSTLAYAGKYRSKARIPALTYLHWANHASITRSSQPMVGLKNARSAQDERLVECIFASHQAPDTAYASPLETSPTPPHVYGATATNLIVDARPTANAMVNVAVGAGTENMDNYRTAKKAYLGIDNIHVMRNSLKQVVEAIREVEDVPSSTIDRGLLRKSNWLKHISTLLDGALVIVKNVHLNASHVLIHCSDGWDRTSQLSAIAQLCLDPYYRTFEGFKILIEKDWLAFGHKFLDRSGHLSSEKLFTVEDNPDDESDDEGQGGGAAAQKAAQAFLAWGQKQFASNSHVKETSPVFHQFLDCAQQLQRQFPDRFEFNEEYLIDLHYHLYACQFGTFLFNNEKDRRVPITEKAYVDRTVSAWEWFDRPEERQKYVNLEYNPKLDDRESRAPDADQGVLMFDPRDVRFWHRLFRRGDEEMNGGKIVPLPTGADALMVVAGQADPVLGQGMIGISDNDNPEHLVKGGTAEVPRKESPAPASTSLWSEGGRAATQDRREEPRAPRPQSGGWNWSKVSSGAFSALQGAAKDLRAIGTEAYNQIRAEASEVSSGEMWSRGDHPGGESEGAQPNPADRIGGEKWGGAGGARAPQEGRLPRTVGRIPSEANPWSTGASTGASDGAVSTAEISTKPETAEARPTNQRDSSWNTNPWDDPPPTKPVNPPTREVKPQKATKGLADLTLHGRPPVATSVPNGAPASVGGKKDESKSWDPLGAL